MHGSRLFLKEKITILICSAKKASLPVFRLLLIRTHRRAQIKIGFNLQKLSNIFTINLQPKQNPILIVCSVFTLFQTLKSTYNIVYLLFM